MFNANIGKSIHQRHAHALSQQVFFFKTNASMFSCSKAGVTNSLDGHNGPVTGIDTHCVQGAVDFSHLYLTSSFDWTVKLWSTRVSWPHFLATTILQLGVLFILLVLCILSVLSILLLFYYHLWH